MAVNNRCNGPNNRFAWLQSCEGFVNMGCEGFVNMVAGPKEPYRIIFWTPSSGVCTWGTDALTTNMGYVGCWKWWCHEYILIFVCCYTLQKSRIHMNGHAARRSSWDILQTKQSTSRTHLLGKGLVIFQWCPMIKNIIHKNSRKWTSHSTCWTGCQSLEELSEPGGARWKDRHVTSEVQVKKSGDIRV
jgi:hypothetical protein